MDSHLLNPWRPAAAPFIQNVQMGIDNRFPFRPYRVLFILHQINEHYTNK